MGPKCRYLPAAPRGNKNLSSASELSEERSDPRRDSPLNHCNPSVENVETFLKLFALFECGIETKLKLFVMLEHRIETLCNVRPTVVVFASRGNVISRTCFREFDRLQERGTRQVETILKLFAIFFESVVEAKLKLF